jgi:hypothetical protein
MSQARWATSTESGPIPPILYFPGGGIPNPSAPNLEVFP